MPSIMRIHLNILSSLTHPLIISNPYDFLSSVEKQVLVALLLFSIQLLYSKKGQKLLNFEKETQNHHESAIKWSS